jgi:acyl-coenzyme A synthetase/AMP-(fatty) acid ligase
MGPHSLFTFDQIQRSRELGGRHYDWVAWDLLKRNADVYGDRPALADTWLGLGDRRELTWRDVLQEVNTLIAHMLDRGVLRGDVLVSQLPNAVESVFLDLATSKVSAQHAGLNVDLGKSETQGAVRKLRPRVAFVIPEWHGRPFLDWYRELQAEIPAMEIVVLVEPGQKPPEGTTALHQWLDGRIWSRFQESDLNYLKPSPLDVHELLPTAGTTGVPKLSRRTTLDWFQVHSVCIAERAGHSVYDRRLLFGPLSGGSGRLWGVHTPLYTGGSVLYLTEFDEETVCRLTESERITIWVWNPALITRVVTSPFFEQYDLSSLRMVSYSGAPLPGEAIDRLMQKGVVPFNVYGTSEVGGCMSPILAGIDREHLLLAAGVPFEGFDVPVVDAAGERLPPGEVGEILIWNVHHGYFQDPDESLNTYHDTEYGGRWEGYQRTGDLGVYDREGYLRVIGRKKDMILRGGQNIFPREIEDLLSQHDSVRDVAVVGMPDPVLGERVCAYVVPAVGKSPDVGEFQALLEARGIAKFKWPERVELVDEMPLGPGGKIQKMVLRERIAKRLEEEADIGRRD